jgi:molecular chaperone IbpA
MINNTRYAILPNGLPSQLMAQMTNLFEAVRPFAESKIAPSFPYSDVIKVSDNEYGIVLALAGFAPDDITITVEDKVLVVSGTPVKRAENVQYLQKGIANRPFEKKFELGEYVEVVGAQHKHGLLEINLVRKLPESRQPRKIEIQVGEPLKDIPAPTVE